MKKKDTPVMSIQKMAFKDARASLEFLVSDLKRR